MSLLVQKLPSLSSIYWKLKTAPLTADYLMLKAAPLMNEQLIKAVSKAAFGLWLMPKIASAKTTATVALASARATMEPIAPVVRFAWQHSGNILTAASLCYALCKQRARPLNPSPASKPSVAQTTTVQPVQVNIYLGQQPPAPTPAAIQTSPPTSVPRIIPRVIQKLGNGKEAPRI